MVKLASSMHRHGATGDELPALLAAVHAAGLPVAAYALHLPLAGSDDARLAEIEAWLPLVPALPASKLMLAEEFARRT